MALVVIIPFSVAFYSLLQIFFQFGQIQAAAAESPFLLAVELQEGLDNRQIDAISSSILAMKEIASTQLDLPIPEWNGAGGQRPEWERIWKANLTPILYASLEPRENAPESASHAARMIRGVTGVVQVVWDQERLDALAVHHRQWRQADTYFSLGFFFYMAAIVGGLLSGFPVRLRRQYVVRTGMGGAGSQVSPEKIWMQITIGNALMASAAYGVIYTAGYWLCPFAPAAPNSVFWPYLAEGTVVTGALVAAVCLVGWWTPSEEVDAVTVTRPPALF